MNEAMNISDDVSAIINDKKYLDATMAIANAIKVPYEDDASFFIKEICRNYLKASGCAQQELLDCLHNDSHKLVSFSIIKWRLLEGMADEQDFQEGEEIEEDPVDGAVKSSPIGPAFLFGYLCEFCLIKYKSDSDLSAYLKRLKMSGQKKYMKNIKRLFSEVVH